MKSGKNNKTLKLLGATAVTLFSLVTVFAATIAWFALNDNTNGNGLTITVTQDEDSVETPVGDACRAHDCRAGRPVALRVHRREGGMDRSDGGARPQCSVA